jgi:lipid-A-disaccharide synthase
MKYYLIAGEASGDLHGANLMHQLKTLDANAQFRCWGGDLMQAAGGHIVKHYRHLAFMGFVEVALHLRTILKNLTFCKQDIKAFNPDVVILIDYPGFNLRIAKFAKNAGYKVLYYISPQVWAWKSSRVKAMKKHIDHLFVILPFEEAYYKQNWQWQVTYCGHPLLDAIAQRLPSLQTVSPQSLDLPANQPIVALLPGSRKQELQRILPVILQAATYFKDLHFAIAAAPGLPLTYYQQFLETLPQNCSVSILQGKTYELIHIATAALVTSGTATLETALIGTPQVVCYKTNALTFKIARWLVRGIKYISLVNLIADAPVLPELIQNEMTVDAIKNNLTPLLHPDNPIRKKQLAHYHQLRQALGGEGASARVAQKMWHLLTTKA